MNSGLADNPDRPSTWPAARDQEFRCRIVRVTSAGLTGVAFAGDDEELLLLCELTSPQSSPPPVVTLELWRGRELRDQQRHEAPVPVDGSWLAAFRLHRSSSSGRSSRLSCRILLNGREVARLAVLTGRPIVDAQGRLGGETARAATPETLLEYQRELNRRLQRMGDVG